MTSSAPIKYIPGVFNADFVDVLWEIIPWVSGLEGVPRFECWMNDYQDPYTYGAGEYARTYEALPKWNPDADNIRTALNLRDMAEYDCCFINGYAHGRQHLGWHADDSPEMDNNHPIAVVSFGAEREIWFREKIADGNVPYGDPHKVTLGNGSVLIMEAGMQKGWQHRIPKSPLGDQCGKRISFTFRKLVR